MPLLGNPTAAVLYPGKLIYAVLPYPWAARVYIMAHSALAFLAMLVTVRSWGVSWVGSGLAALTYAFGAPVLFQYCNVIYLVGAAWLPLRFPGRRALAPPGQPLGAPGAGRRPGDADAGRRPPVGLSAGPLRRRLCGGTGLEPRPRTADERPGRRAAAKGWSSRPLAAGAPGRVWPSSSGWPAHSSWPSTPTRPASREPGSRPSLDALCSRRRAAGLEPGGALVADEVEGPRNVAAARGHARGAWRVRRSWRPPSPPRSCFRSSNSRSRRSGPREKGRTTSTPSASSPSAWRS